MSPREARQERSTELQKRKGQFILRLFICVVTWESDRFIFCFRAKRFGLTRPASVCVVADETSL